MANSIIKVILIILFLPGTILATEGSKSERPKGSYPDEGIFTGTKNNNLILNPGFENRTSNWILGKHNGGAGLFTIDSTTSISGESSALLITENDNNDIGALYLFTNFPLTSLTSYSITFRAKVKTVCLISISFTNGFDAYFEKEILLQPDTEFYGPFTFSSKYEDLFTYFSFNLGKTNATILLDDIDIHSDQTEKEFKQIIASSGINIFQHQTDLENSIYINLPKAAVSDIPIILYDQKKNIVLSSRIIQGESEASISFKDQSESAFLLKIFTSTKEENFMIQFERPVAHKISYSASPPAAQKRKFSFPR